MKKDLLFLLGLAVLIVGLLAFGSYFGTLPVTKKPQSQITTQVKIKNQTFKAEIAKTVAQHTKGLSGRDGLASDTGMLFVFDKPDKYQFWMKDTKIPIDIIWLDQNKRIVDYYKEAQPEPGVADPQLRIYTPAYPALYVLEFNAKTIDRYQIISGDYADFDL